MARIVRKINIDRLERAVCGPVSLCRDVGKRRQGRIIRLLYDGRMPPEILEHTAEAFGVRKKRFLKKSGQYLHLSDLMSIGEALDRPALRAPPFAVTPCADLRILLILRNCPL